MTKYYKISVTCTGRGYGPKEEPYHIFDRFELTFQTQANVNDYLAVHYGKCKRNNIYIDKKDDSVEQTGYVYCFNNADISHSPVEKWRQQDWVTITEVTETPAV